ncbi:MAG: bifunctional 3-deoxy-7-phosphoheptulonate synthase/chorismate mutase type II [Bacteroidia bacterium]|nr:bifunctional 3-deoxy-7-phosphoheptulonate synthase/chorismate mutase type II [Bacteroidia bacterium]MCZ2277464.1 bifunctional 3-deoxy-7-phosphoheptulonate synthase/chorismate mutase type II [Bacteroidia bacterium]
MIKLIPVQNWVPSLSGPLIIAGPCGAESYQQIMITAQLIKATGKAHILRAGIWKPRTRPGSFEGKGEQALSWLAEAGRKTGLLTAVEVGNSYHVEKALKAGIDVLWLGARTTVNPFYVQEIAKALIGTDVPVMVKNPVSPDLQLWIGALERLNKAGIGKLLAVHRGFTSLTSSSLRNAPHWEIVIELKRQLPDVAVICDVSHISGKQEFIPAIAQHALDLDLQGLMIETHYHPEEALSDSQQQITPRQFNELIEKLNVRKSKSDDIVFKTTIEELRNHIDSIDHELLQLLAGRFRLVQRIGEFKNSSNVTLLQLKRWTEMLEDRVKQGKTEELDEVFVTRLFEFIHNESLRLQNQILNSDHDAEQPLLSKYEQQNNSKS